jgi:SseB protein N-terminal domain
MGDTGDADPAVRAALAAYADGTGTEHAALTVLAAARLLVPVVAVPAEAGEDGAEKETEMALPTLIGNDGRKAVLAFTGTRTLRLWKEDARPVPVPARSVWAAARAEADAAVIDIAGPVRLVVEGARLTALANGEPPPLPHEDPDIRAEIAAVTSGFTLEPSSRDADLAIILATTDMAEAREAASQIAARLAPRLRRGIEIRTSLSRTYAPDSRRPMTPHPASPHPGCKPPAVRRHPAGPAARCPAVIVDRQGPYGVSADPLSSEPAPEPPQASPHKPRGPQRHQAPGSGPDTHAISLDCACGRLPTRSMLTAAVLMGHRPWLAREAGGPRTSRSLASPPGHAPPAGPAAPGGEAVAGWAIAG